MALNLPTSNLDSSSIEHHWKEQCEAVMRSCRIVQGHMALEVEAERRNVTTAMGVARVEKLERLKKENEIKQLQIRQQDLEWAIEDLKKNMKEKTVEYNALRQEHLDLKYHYDVMDTKLQIARLHHDRTQAMVKELERLNKELRRKNESNFNTKIIPYSGRTTRELQQRLQELQEAGDDERQFSAMELTKEKGRVDKLKNLLSKWECYAETHKKEKLELATKFANLEKTCAKLKAAAHAHGYDLELDSPQPGAEAEGIHTHVRTDTAFTERDHTVDKTEANPRMRHTRHARLEDLDPGNRDDTSNIPIPKKKKRKLIVPSHSCGL